MRQMQPGAGQLRPHSHSSALVAPVNSLYPQSGPAVQNDFGAGFGGVGKPQKPGLGDGNRLGAGAFPGTGVQSGLGEGLKPQKPGPAPQNGYGPDYGGVKSQKPGFRNGNGLGLGAQSGPPVQNGRGPDIRGGMKPPKAGFGVGRKAQKSGPAARNGYGRDYGTDMRPQKQGFRNGHGLGIQLGYRNGLGTRAFRGQGPHPGYKGNGMAAQPPGPCNGGLVPPQLLPGSPTPGVPSDKGGAWGLKSQLLPPVQNAKSPAPTPAIQWGLKPQKAGHQPSNRYGAEAELGFHGGFKLQKVGFHYGNGALEAGVFPETLQSMFPINNGFRNGLREETLLYPKATVLTLERNGQAGALQGSPWLALQPWGAGMKPGYGYAGVGNQAGPYGQLRPELGLDHFGEPLVKQMPRDSW